MEKGSKNLSVKVNINNAYLCSNGPQSKNISFGGQRLFPVSLLKIVDKKTKFNIPAYFTKLDSEDLALMYDVCDAWEHSKYGEIICKGFIRKAHGYAFARDFDYFMIETNSAKNKEEAVKSIAQINYNKKLINIDFLQSRSEIERNEKIKGGATMLVYGICKYAKQIKSNCIKLYSDNAENDKMYKKIGFIEVAKSLFILDRKNFNKVIKNIEKIFLK